MIISYQWLMDYTSVEIPLETLSTILTNIGLEVEAIEAVEAVPGGLKGVVVGEVVACVPHPNADRLRCTKVDVGQDQLLSIVCGAPNVAQGQKVLVATEGTELYPKNKPSFTIKKAKIRGEESRGMICAEDELGLSEQHDGIMVLPKDAPIGQDAAAYLKLPSTDHALHIGLTPNRSDANAHIGVAREVMAWWQYHQKENTSLIWPIYNEDITKGIAEIEVEVQDEQACPRYMGVLLDKVQVQPSPEWLQNRLKAIGLRPINNVVDITNYVLHECGNPLHAFDADTIKGKVIVRKAKADERFITLDDKELKLRQNDLVIADEEKALCLAGVMGGKNSAVHFGTNRIFLEAALFDAGTIRNTSLEHQIRSDAATHFEKGVCMHQVEFALRRTVYLLQEIAGAQVMGSYSDYYPKQLPQKEISLRVHYVQQITGHPFSADDIRNILQALGFEVSGGASLLQVKVPEFKTDIFDKEDLAEEVLRLHGLDNIAIPTQMKIELGISEFDFDAYWENELSTWLVARGFQEILTNSIINFKHYPQYEPQMVRMINSLSTELNAMRPHMLLSGLEVVAYNSNRKQEDLRLFEFGCTYQQLAQERYTQKKILACWISGQIAETSWNQPAQSVDVFYLKGLLQAMAQRCGIKNLQFDIRDVEIAITQGKKELGWLRKASDKEKQTVGVKQDVWYFQLDWEEWLAVSAKGKMRYREVPRYPVVKRDLAVVVDKEIAYDSLAHVTHQLKLKPLKDFYLFDVFEHEKLGKDKKSLALQFRFQLEDRTLTDEETEALMQQLIKAYEKQLNAQIRS